MEPALADSTTTLEEPEPSRLALGTPFQLSRFDANGRHESALLAPPQPSVDDLLVGTMAFGGHIVLSTDLADAERVLQVQRALAEGFTSESVSAPSTSGTQITQLLRLAPVVHTSRRTERYRMPRPVKRQLLDGFCGLSGTAASPRTLMVVAHPDDESIGGGARLAALGEAWVAYVTNGSPLNPEVARRHAFESREAYAEQRHREALAALSLAGIPDERVHWFDIDDGQAARNLVDLCLGVAELLDRVRPNVVVTHPYEGGHTDHDATAFAVHLACGILRREGVRTPAVFELASYNAVSGEKVVQEFLPHRRADLDRRLLRLGHQQRELKRKMFACYSTQQSVLRDFDPGIEKFRPAPRYVFTEPPHPGVLNYERYGDPALGRRFREAVDEALRELRLRRAA